MRSKTRMAAFAACMVSLAMAATAAPAAPASFANGVEVTAAEQGHLMSLRGAMPKNDEFSKSRVSHPARPLPWLDGPGTPVDGAQQGQAFSVAAPTMGLGFDGVGKGFTGPQGTFTVNAAPPDTNGAVGTTQYVQTVNTALAVFDKGTGNVVYGPVPINTLFQPLGGSCAADNDGDPVVVFDKLAKRWVISQFAVTAAPYYQCVAVSQTEDATGAYNLYAFNYGSVFPDYPKMGVWTDAYYISFNMFNGNTFAGSKACAYDRASMLAGAPATQQCVQLSTSYGGLLPADLDGTTAPPAGAPGIFMARGSSALYRWLMGVNWSNPSATTFSSTPTSLPVASYAAACGGGTCVPQSGVAQKLDSLADRLMFRLAYRNFGTYDSVVVTHSVQIGNYRKGDNTAVRWYEVRNPATANAVYQQGTYNPDSTFRWMGSIAQDKQGNMALGYSVSSTTLHPGIRVAMRGAGDALGTLQAETSILEGTGSQTGSNLSRWGDYSAMTVDPVDDCTFWYTTEYLKANGAFNWSTRIASFKYPGCQ
ncbi:MAG: hypothetical protein ACXWC6_04970 [Ramlibacter sp.]